MVSCPSRSRAAVGLSAQARVSRLRELRGCPVLSAATGARLGRVSEVVLDLGRRCVVGFRLRYGGLLDRRWRLAALLDLTAVRADAIVVPDDVALREDERPAGHLLLGRRAIPVLTAGGALVAWVTDVEAELPAGTLLGLLVVPAMGRGVARREPVSVPIDRVSAVTDHAVIVDEAATHALRGRGTT